jgi:tetratricopeptide (TPR) repeat protein
MSLLYQAIEKAYELFEKKEFNLSLQTALEAEELLKGEENSNTLSEEEKTEITGSLENFKGFNYLSLEQIAEAKDAFENSLNINPNSSQACAGMGEVFFLLERDEEAKVMFEWALDNSPTNLFAKAGLAKVNKRLGLPENHTTLNVETTLRRKDDFFKLISDSYRLFTEYKYEESLKKLADVEVIFNSGITSRTSAAKIVSLENFKGFNYLALDRTEEAKDCFERALNINPASSQACAGLAEIFYLQGREKEAKSMFEWAVKHNNINEFAVEGLKKTNIALGLDANDNSLTEQ